VAGRTAAEDDGKGVPDGLPTRCLRRQCNDATESVKEIVSPGLVSIAQGDGGGVERALRMSNSESWLGSAKTPPIWMPMPEESLSVKAPPLIFRTL